MPPEMRVPGTGDNVGESRWTDTYVVHSRNRLIHRIRYGVYERAFFGHVAGKDARILDVGCGSGEFISLLRQRGYTNLQGVEIDDALIDLAAELPDVIRKSSATALPYADGSFDCIYMFNVMHHLHGMAEYERALAEMGRCLRDGGRIILVEPCRLVLYRLLKWVCFIGRPFGPFFRNFYVILQEEWPELSSFLRHLDPLRARIAATKGFVVQEDRKLLHQWITVITVDKGAPRATTEQAGRCDSQN
jgi:SAM-dependent methyltransferase